MNSNQFFTSAWQWNPALLLICAAAVCGYFAVFGRRGRAGYFVAAVIIFLFALLSPLGTLANGYLFSAHMTQHILLVLIVPALLLLSLPRTFSLPRRLQIFAHPLVGWSAGVGAMWLWHAPTLCNAATTSRTVFAIETTTLMIMGGLFWWQVIAPREADRLSPLLGIGYLFTACVACSVLGIIITFAPVSVCRAFQHPADQFGILPHDSQRLGPDAGARPADRRPADVGADVLDLRGRYPGAARPVACAATLGGNSCLTKNHQQCRPAGRFFRKSHSRDQPTSRPALAMGVAFLSWGLITSWVILLVGLVLFTAALAGWITEIRHGYKSH